MKRSITLASSLSAVAALLLMASVGISADTTPAKPAGTAVITGKVTDASGKAAANVKVSLTSATAAPAKTADKPAGKKGGKGGMAALATTMTDSEGAFKFDALAAGDYNVSAGGKGVGHGTTKVTVEDGKTVTAEIQLKAPKAPGNGANGGNGAAPKTN